MILRRSSLGRIGKRENAGWVSEAAFGAVITEMVRFNSAILYACMYDGFCCGFREELQSVWEEVEVVVTMA